MLNLVGARQRKQSFCTWKCTNLKQLQQNSCVKFAEASFFECHISLICIYNNKLTKQYFNGGAMWHPKIGKKLTLKSSLKKYHIDASRYENITYIFTYSFVIMLCAAASEVATKKHSCYT